MASLCAFNVFSKPGDIISHFMLSRGTLPVLDCSGSVRSWVQEASRLAADQGLRGADSFYVPVAARLHLPLITLDEDQKTKADSVIAVHALDKPI